LEAGSDAGVSQVGEDRKKRRRPGECRPFKIKRTLSINLCGQNL
jgi:hypothetical protein